MHITFSNCNSCYRKRQESEIIALLVMSCHENSVLVFLCIHVNYPIDIAFIL
jgi:hypothetical protein